MEKIKFEVPKKSEFISCIRLTTSSISNISGFDVEKIEDIKVVISEICIFFINNIKKTTENFLIEYFVDSEKIMIEVTDKNCGKLLAEVIEENEMFLLIIGSLSDCYKIDYDNNKVIFEMKI